MPKGRQFSDSHRAESQNGRKASEGLDETRPPLCGELSIDDVPSDSLSDLSDDVFLADWPLDGEYYLEIEGNQCRIQGPQSAPAMHHGGYPPQCISGVTSQVAGHVSRPPGGAAASRLQLRRTPHGEAFSDEDVQSPLTPSRTSRVLRRGRAFDSVDVHPDEIARAKLDLFAASDRNEFNENNVESKSFEGDNNRRRNSDDLFAKYYNKLFPQGDGQRGVSDESFSMNRTHLLSDGNDLENDCHNRCSVVAMETSHPCTVSPGNGDSHRLMLLNNTDASKSNREEMNKYNHTTSSNLNFEQTELDYSLSSADLTQKDVKKNTDKINYINYTKNCNNISTEYTAVGDDTAITTSQAIDSSAVNLNPHHSDTSKCLATRENSGDWESKKEQPSRSNAAFYPTSQPHLRVDFGNDAMHSIAVQNLERLNHSHLTYCHNSPSIYASNMSDAVYDTGDKAETANSEIKNTDNILVDTPNTGQVGLSNPKDETIIFPPIKNNISAVKRSANASKICREEAVTASYLQAKCDAKIAVGDAIVKRNDATIMTDTGVALTREDNDDNTFADRVESDVNAAHSQLALGAAMYTKNHDVMTCNTKINDTEMASPGLVDIQEKNIKMGIESNIQISGLNECSAEENMTEKCARFEKDAGKTDAEVGGRVKDYELRTDASSVHSFAAESGLAFGINLNNPGTSFTPDKTADLSISSGCSHSNLNDINPENKLINEGLGVANQTLPADILMSTGNNYPGISVDRISKDKIQSETNSFNGNVVAHMAVSEGGGQGVDSSLLTVDQALEQYNSNSSLSEALSWGSSWDGSWSGDDVAYVQLVDSDPGNTNDPEDSNDPDPGEKNDRDPGHTNDRDPGDKYDRGDIIESESQSPDKFVYKESDNNTTSGRSILRENAPSPTHPSAIIKCQQLPPDSQCDKNDELERGRRDQKTMADKTRILSHDTDFSDRIVGLTPGGEITEKESVRIRGTLCETVHGDKVENSSAMSEPADPIKPLVSTQSKNINQIISHTEVQYDKADVSSLFSFSEQLDNHFSGSRNAVESQCPLETSTEQNSESISGDNVRCRDLEHQDRVLPDVGTDTPHSKDACETFVLAESFLPEVHAAQFETANNENVPLSKENCDVTYSGDVIQNIVGDVINSGVINPGTAKTSNASEGVGVNFEANLTKQGLENTPIGITSALTSNVKENCPKINTTTAAVGFDKDRSEKIEEISVDGYESVCRTSGNRVPNLSESVRCFSEKNSIEDIRQLGLVERNNELGFFESNNENSSCLSNEQRAQSRVKSVSHQSDAEARGGGERPSTATQQYNATNNSEIVDSKAVENQKQEADISHEVQVNPGVTSRHVSSELDHIKHSSAIYECQNISDLDMDKKMSCGIKSVPSTSVTSQGAIPKNGSRAGKSTTPKAPVMGLTQKVHVIGAPKSSVVVVSQKPILQNIGGKSTENVSSAHAQGVIAPSGVKQKVINAKPDTAKLPGAKQNSIIKVTNANQDNVHSEGSRPNASKSQGNRLNIDKSASTVLKSVKPSNPATKDANAASNGTERMTSEDGATIAAEVPTNAAAVGVPIASSGDRKSKKSRGKRRKVRSKNKKTSVFTQTWAATQLPVKRVDFACQVYMPGEESYVYGYCSTDDEVDAINRT